MVKETLLKCRKHMERTQGRNNNSEQRVGENMTLFKDNDLTTAMYV